MIRAHRNSCRQIRAQPQISAFTSFTAGNSHPAVSLGKRVHASMWAGPNTIEPFLAASLIGFASGTAISVLLLVLTVRAAMLPGTI